MARARGSLSNAKIGGRIDIPALACGKQREASGFAFGILLDDSSHVLYPPHHCGHGHGFPDGSAGRVETQRIEPVTVSVCLEDRSGEALGIARDNRSIKGQIVIAVFIDPATDSCCRSGA